MRTLSSWGRYQTSEDARIRSGNFRALFRHFPIFKVSIRSLSREKNKTILKKIRRWKSCKFTLRKTSLFDVSVGKFQLKVPTKSIDLKLSSWKPWTSNSFEPPVVDHEASGGGQQADNAIVWPVMIGGSFLPSYSIGLSPHLETRSSSRTDRRCRLISELSSTSSNGSHKHSRRPAWRVSIVEPSLRCIRWGIFIEKYSLRKIFGEDPRVNGTKWRCIRHCCERTTILIPDSESDRNRFLALVSWKTSQSKRRQWRSLERLQHPKFGCKSDNVR